MHTRYKASNKHCSYILPGTEQWCLWFLYLVLLLFFAPVATALEAPADQPNNGCHEGQFSNKRTEYRTTRKIAHHTPSDECQSKVNFRQSKANFLDNRESVTAGRRVYGQISTRSSLSSHFGVCSITHPCFGRKSARQFISGGASVLYVRRYEPTRLMLSYEQTTDCFRKISYF